MITLYKDPAGDNIFTSTTGKNTWTGGGGVAGNGNSQEEAAEISTLRKRVTELEQTLAQMKVQHNLHDYAHALALASYTVQWQLI